MAQSTSWEVDSYRTVVYPAVIRAAAEVGARLGVPWNALLYVGQLAVAAAAAWYLVGTLRPGFDRWRTAALTAVLVTVPLPLHYTARVLTDSLAASALVVLTAGLARVVVRDDTSWRPLAVVALGTAGSVMLRPERLYVVLAVVLLAAALALVRLRPASARPLGAPAAARVVIAVLVAVVVPALGLTAVNRSVQTADLGREPATTAGAVFDRVVYPHLDRARELLPRTSRLPSRSCSSPSPSRSSSRRRPRARRAARSPRQGEAPQARSCTCGTSTRPCRPPGRALEARWAHGRAGRARPTARHP